MTSFQKSNRGLGSKDFWLVLSLILLYTVTMYAVIEKEEPMTGYCEICDNRIEHNEPCWRCTWCKLGPLCQRCSHSFSTGYLCDFCIETVEEIVEEMHGLYKEPTDD